MRTTQRHRLKENEFAHVIDRAAVSLEANRRRVLAIAALVVIVLGAFGGYLLWRARTSAAAGELLARASVVLDAPVAASPSPGQSPEPGSYPTEQAKLEAGLATLLSAAEAYPRTAAGVAARYRAAGVLGLLDRPEEAAARFQEVMDLAGRDSVYYDMARLGRIVSQAQAAHYDQAIAALQGFTSGSAGEVPPDAVLMQLGRVYLMAGKTTEAQQAFQRLLDEYPESQSASDARREVEALKVGG